MGKETQISHAYKAEPPSRRTLKVLRHRCTRLKKDSLGGVLVEAAVVLPVIILLLLGIVTYGLWLMTANSLQQVANEAARATLGSLTAAERQQRVTQAIASSLLQTGAVSAENVTVSTAVAGAYYTVTLSYDTSANALFSSSIVPLPSSNIVRHATVEAGGV